MMFFVNNCIIFVYQVVLQIFDFQYYKIFIQIFNNSFHTTKINLQYLVYHIIYNTINVLRLQNQGVFEIKYVLEL